MESDSLRSLLQQRLTSHLEAAERLRTTIETMDEEIASSQVERPLSDDSKVPEDKHIQTRYAAGAPRPPEVPTNNEMFAKVLQQAQRDGAEGLTSSEIVAAIRQRFWPGVNGCQLRPALYAAVKAGKLAKTAEGIFKAEWRMRTQ